MYLEKAILTEINPQGGALFCNAIDDDLYDSTQWDNRMPCNSIDFNVDEHGNSITTYTSYFACYDGWDSDSQTETHHSLKSAVNSAWLNSYPDTGRCPTLQGIYEKATNNI